MSSPYDLISVNVGDKETMARPYEFEGEYPYLIPVKFNSSCPHCGKLLDFKEVEIINGKVPCKSCGVGTDEALDEPFVDPIEFGIVLEHEIVEGVLIKEKTIKVQKPEPKGDIDLNLVNNDDTVADRVLSQPTKADVGKLAERARQLAEMADDEISGEIDDEIDLGDIDFDEDDE